VPSESDAASLLPQAHKAAQSKTARMNFPECFPVGIGMFERGNLTALRISRQSDAYNSREENISRNNKKN